MVRKTQVSRKPNSEVEAEQNVADLTIDERVAALEEQVNEILDTYDPQLSDRHKLLEQKLDRHGIRITDTGT